MSYLRHKELILEGKRYVDIDTICDELKGVYKVNPWTIKRLARLKRVKFKVAGSARKYYFNPDEVASFLLNRKINMNTMADYLDLAGL